MDKSPSLINRYPVLLGISLLILSTVFCWLMFLKYGSANIFYVLNVMYLLCIVLFIIGAMKYKDVNLITGILLSVASLLFIMALFDFYLITFCYETSGPGGEHVISHRNWHNKFVWKNEQGFWERSLAAFEKTDRRNKGLVIAVVGDSFTWGQGIKGNKHRFTEQLEEKLNSVLIRGEKDSRAQFWQGRRGHPAGNSNRQGKRLPKFTRILSLSAIYPMILIRAASPVIGKNMAIPVKNYHP